MKNRKPYQNSVVLFLVIGILFLLVLFPMHSPGKSQKGRFKAIIDLLFQQKRYDAAEACCRRLLGKPQKQCYRCLGDAFFNIGDYKKAGEYYRKCEYTEGHLRIIDVYLQMKAYERALAYCEKLQLISPEAYGQMVHRMGIAHFGLGNYEKAVEYFEEAMPSAPRAAAYERLAEIYHQKDNKTSAKIYYNKAVRDYEFLLKHFFYEWKNEYITPLRRCIARRDQYEKTAGEKEKQVLLNRVLQGVGKYCQKMKNSAFHFFCQEEIVELIDFSVEAAHIEKIPKEYRGIEVLPWIKNTYLYEYQLIKEGKEINETRTLIKQNSFKKNQADAPLLTRGHKYEKLIFGPLALLSEFWQYRFYFNVLREEKLWGEDTAVIEAIPLHLYAQNHLFGSIWISKNDFTVLKIQWNPRSIGRSHQIEKKARALDAAPNITFFAEFREKKRGIRFPSRYYLEEAYINKKGKKYVRLRQDVTLKDYMFFVVASEVVETKPGTLKRR
ncbi:MAG: tetratricopeptide repeat protein [Candidatus Aminicenantes bacterium]|nr:tetratricopeptide repeat protein [Candidatus Aminicenantes bacterium]NIN20101.1 tetratricopeptide repeat protein [Candidatus Aminicenantes bacterium]NIN43888.1 tetratricopeptide repeat protein [Candidatus Aminicenantes bacterium]NIN86697.1 tetratricopeptide repeat protein [Candidatus Aminicenantes bacterium]NIO82947.1 tetratricopeptide repeat protein [Candidatus Aminicenantes bacterium]